ncbi:MAG: hypothetical protein ABI467_07520 [Kofleriaceae bacterium]
MSDNAYVFSAAEAQTIARLAATVRINAIGQLTGAAVLAVAGGVVLVKLGVSVLPLAVWLCVLAGCLLFAVCGVWLRRAAHTLRRIATSREDHTAVVLRAFALLAKVYRTQLRLMLLVTAAGIAIELIAGHL